MNGINAQNVFVQGFIGWMQKDEKKLAKYQRVKEKDQKKIKQFLFLS